MAEVSVSQAGELQVDRVVVVTDIGAQIINPSGAENQVQGSVIDALGTLQHAELDIDRGRAVQGNFGDYPLIRIHRRRCPAVRAFKSRPVGHPLNRCLDI